MVEKTFYILDDGDSSVGIFPSEERIRVAWLDRDTIDDDEIFSK